MMDNIEKVLDRGRAVQIDPIKPTLRAPAIKLLKLTYDEVLSSFAFSFNLRRYTAVRRSSCWWIRRRTCGFRQGLTLVNFSAQRKRFLSNRGGR